MHKGEFGNNGGSRLEQNAAGDLLLPNALVALVTNTLLHDRIDVSRGRAIGEVLRDQYSRGRGSAPEAEFTAAILLNLSVSASDICSCHGRLRTSVFLHAFCDGPIARADGSAGARKGVVAFVDTDSAGEAAAEIDCLGT